MMTCNNEPICCDDWSIDDSWSSNRQFGDEIVRFKLFAS